MCIMFVYNYTLLKVVSYYDLNVLSVSVMGFQKKFGWAVGGSGELYPDLFQIFGICLTLQSSLPCIINCALASAVSTPLLATHVYVPVSNVYVAYMVREWSTSFLEHRCARSKSINQPSFVQSTFKFSTS